MRGGKMSHKEVSRYFFVKEIDGRTKHNKIIEIATNAAQNMASLPMNKYKEIKIDAEKIKTIIKLRHII